jgi:hypothetical protein
MAALRRHATLSVSVLAVLILITGTVLLWPRPTAQAQGGPYAPLRPDAAAQLQALRNAAALDDDALITLNADPTQLEHLLSSLRQWAETHDADWRAASSAVADAQARIRLLVAAQNIGQDRTADLAAAQQQLAPLQTQLDTLLQQARTACLAGLSNDQLAQLEHLRSQPNLPMTFRLLTLTPDQQQALSQLNTDYNQQIALVRDPQARGALADAYNRQLADLIGPTNAQTLSTFNAFAGPASERVVTTLNLVLPVSP